MVLILAWACVVTWWWTVNEAEIAGIKEALGIEAEAEMVYIS